MQSHDSRGEPIREFFESDENRNLFSNCPFRRFLSHLEEFDTQSVDHILAHMMGHILDYRAGQPSGADPNQAMRAINQDDLDNELRYVYNDCNNAKLNEARKINPRLKPDDSPEYHGFGPEQRGCFGNDARAELMAEAIRAYLQDPNYLKTVAPNVAARIRGAINTTPDLNSIIQFN